MDDPGERDQPLPVHDPRAAGGFTSAPIAADLAAH
jgi:hypothetical protein